MTFSISLPSMFNRTIGLNILEELYKTLLDLEMIMLAILINFLRHEQSLMMNLRCLHNNLSGSGNNELLHLRIVLLNFSLENDIYIVNCLV